MPLLRFISPTDPRFLSTLEAVGRNVTDDSLIYRYATADGLRGNEGSFTMCSFWYVECLARAGDVAWARFLFEKMLGYTPTMSACSPRSSARRESISATCPRLSPTSP